jgi:hypothetical protein
MGDAARVATPCSILSLILRSRSVSRSLDAYTQITPWTTRGQWPARCTSCQQRARTGAVGDGSTVHRADYNYMGPRAHAARPSLVSTVKSKSINRSRPRRAEGMVAVTSIEL